MKLVFKKNEDSQINVLGKLDGVERDFSYVDMIKALIESKEMEEPEILAGFSDAEIKSIRSMVAFINKEISTTKEAN